MAHIGDTVYRCTLFRIVLLYGGIMPSALTHACQRLPLTGESSLCSPCNTTTLSGRCAHGQTPSHYIIDRLPLLCSDRVPISFMRMGEHSFPFGAGIIATVESPKQADTGTAWYSRTVTLRSGFVELQPAGFACMPSSAAAVAAKLIKTDILGMGDFPAVFLLSFTRNRAGWK